MGRLKSIFVVVMGLLGTLPGGSGLADDGHLPIGPGKTRISGSLPPPALQRRPVNPRQGSHLILEEDSPLSAFDRDRGLTELCRIGRFRQKRDRFLIIRLDGYTHGAVVGGHWSLYDPEGLAVPDLVYAVKGQDTARCEVYVIRHLPPSQ